jgi:surface antigen
MTRNAFLSAATALALAFAFALGGHARAASPTLEIVNMTKYPATVQVHKAGAVYGHYAIPAYGKVAIYGDGAFSFTGTVATHTGDIALPRKETTIARGAATRGLIIEPRGSDIIWTFGQATSGAVM